MTLEDIISLVRQRAGDIDPAALRYGRAEIIAALTHTRRILAVRRVVGMIELNILFDALTGQETLVPEPTDENGVLLAVATARDLLRSLYRERVTSGSIGVSWRSGFEEESTINLQRAYQGEIDAMSSEIEEMLLVIGSQRAGFRAQ